ncbi:MAG TPA: MFS transporter [Dehalococcoidia bacterium]|nr:MFS transporter [Dehalococcoidia bacterium]
MSEAEVAEKGQPTGPRWGAFSYPNYRRFWLASLVRVFGIQFRFIGSGWLVAVELDRSPLWLGVVGLANAIPTITLSMPAGVLADRMDHRRLLVTSQASITLGTLLIALFVVVGAVELWMVIVWSVVNGSLMALATPAQSAILPRLVEMRSMVSAVAANSAIWNSMRILGPALAGVLIAVVGTGHAFLVTAAGYAISTVLLFTLRLAPLERDPGHQTGGMMEGVQYIFSERLFLAVIGLSFFTSVFGMSYQTLLPIIADDILEVGSTGFGFMEAAAGVGALLGTVAIVKIGTRERSGPAMLVGAALFGLLIAAFAATRWLPLSMVLLFTAGFASSVYLNIGMMTLQVLVPDYLRGRVMGIWSMTWFLAAVGGFVAGAAAELIGTPWTVALGGLSVSAFVGFLFAASSNLRKLSAAAPPGSDAPQPAGG